MPHTPGSDFAPAAAPLIRAEGLVVRRGGRTLLQSVDLELNAGELLTLVGPNGAGKSTLLKAAIGLVPVDGGRLSHREGLRLAYVPQYFSVDGNLPLTVSRFLQLQVTPPRGDLAGVVAETRIQPLLKRPMQALSGGESRRVLLARALLRDPQVLALDEPAAGLDLNAQTELYELIQHVRQSRNCGVLVISHDLHLVMAASDQVLCLDNGRIFCRGTPESVREHPEYRALFGHQLGPALGIYTHHQHGPECKH